MRTQTKSGIPGVRSPFLLRYNIDSLRIFGRLIRSRLAARM
jgi:hypothetical protein